MMDSDLPEEVYALFAQLRHTFDRIMCILQEDERRVRRGYELLQQECNAMSKGIVAWHERRGPAAWESTSIGGSDPESTSRFAHASPGTPLTRPTPAPPDGNGDEQSRLLTDNLNGTKGLSNSETGTTEEGDEERERAFDEMSSAQPLARVATSPPCCGNGTSPHAAVAAVTMEDRTTWPAEQAPSPPRAALVSPVREESLLSLRQPETSINKCSGEREESASALRDELRLYAGAVKSPKAYPAKPVAESAYCNSDRSRSRCNPPEDAVDTLTESDHTTTLTNSSYRRDRQIKERFLESYRQTSHASNGVLIPYRGGGYAERMRVQRTKDAATSTVNASVSRSSLVMRNTLLTNTELPQGFWIHVWPCFGTFNRTVKPARIYVYGHCRHIEDIAEKAADELHCKPAPQYFFEPDGNTVRSLRQLLPEQHYLLFPSGGFYREDAVPSSLLRHMVETAKHTLTERSF